MWRRDRPVMMSCSAQNLWEFKSFRGEFEPLISVQFPQTVLNQMETDKEELGLEHRETAFTQQQKMCAFSRSI